MDNVRFNLSRDIQSAYLRKNAKALGRRVYLNDAQKSDKAWIEAAKICDTFQLSPELFVEIIYDNLCGRYRRTLTPGSLCSKNAYNVIKKYCGVYKQKESEVKLEVQDLYKQDVKDYVDSQFEFFNSLYKCQKDIVNKETSPNNERLMQLVRMYAFRIPAWLRVLLLPNDEIVLNRFGNDALEELNGKIRGLKEELSERRYGELDVNELINKLRTRAARHSQESIQ